KRLATARALERLRQRQREKNRLSALPEVLPADRNALEPGRNAETRELAADLRVALTEIDPRQAQVFCRACLADLPYDQIAGPLGHTVNLVGVLLNRARASLRERLRAHAPDTHRLAPAMPS